MYGGGAEGKIKRASIVLDSHDYSFQSATNKLSENTDGVSTTLQTHKSLDKAEMRLQDCLSLALITDY